MHVNYLVVDQDEQFIRIDQSMAEDIWTGRTRVDESEIDLGTELRLVSVLCD